MKPENRRPGVSEEIERDVWKADIKKIKGSGVTQNKLDGPRSGKLCKTSKPSKREKKKKESGRGSLSDHVGRMVKVHHIRLKSRPFYNV